MIILLWLIIISLATIVLNWADKSKAARRSWRISESALHILELLGGWPAAYVSQRLLRHKTAKTSYQVIFWLIVVLHQAVAGGSLLQLP